MQKVTQEEQTTTMTDKAEIDFLNYKNMIPTLEKTLLISSILYNGACVIIIDNSFCKHACNSLGGKYYELDIEKPISINPFSISNGFMHYNLYPNFLEIFQDILNLKMDCDELHKEVLGQAVCEHSFQNIIKCMNNIEGSVEQQQAGTKIAKILEQFEYKQFLIGDTDVDVQNRFIVFNVQDNVLPHKLHLAILIKAIIQGFRSALDAIKILTFKELKEEMEKNISEAHTPQYYQRHFIIYDPLIVDSDYIDRVRQEENIWF